MAASYVAMLIVAVYAWVGVRNYRSRTLPPGSDRASGSQAWVLIVLAGVCVVALVDSLTLVSPLVRLVDPVMIAWLVGFGVLGAVAVLAALRLRTPAPAVASAEPPASADERPTPGP